MEDTTDQIGIIARVVQALQTTNEQGLSGMTRLKEFTMLISPYPDTCHFDTPAEVWTNLGVASLAIVLALPVAASATENHCLVSFSGAQQNVCTGKATSAASTGLSKRSRSSKAARFWRMRNTTASSPTTRM